MTRSRLILTATAAATLLLGACANNSGYDAGCGGRNSIIGGAGLGALGAGIGLLAGGTTGAVAGGLIGAGTGAVGGSQVGC